MVKIYQQWIDKSDINTNTIKLSILVQTNTYSGVYIETQGSGPDQKEDDDEDSESVEKETWRGRADLVILYASSNCLSLNMNIFCSSIFEIIY